MSKDRIKTAYNAFRAGFADPAKCPAPPWDEAPPWVRDVVTVAYLQGTLDRKLPKPLNISIEDTVLA